MTINQAQAITVQVYCFITIIMIVHGMKDVIVLGPVKKGGSFSTSLHLLLPVLGIATTLSATPWISCTDWSVKRSVLR